MTLMTMDVRRNRDFPHLTTALRGIAAAFGQAYRQYRKDRMARAAFLNLLTLDDATLDDIGVTRDEVFRTARLPLAVNAARVLHARTRSLPGLGSFTDK